MIYDNYDACRDTPVKRGDGFILNGNSVVIFRYSCYAHTYDYGSCHNCFIPVDKYALNLAKFYPVISTPDVATSASNLGDLYNRQLEHTKLDLFYPKGTILYTGSGFLVTSAVTNIRNYSGVSYSWLYPWCPDIQFDSGDYVVWDGGVYKANASISARLSPSEDTSNWSLVQSAPFCKIGAVVPYAFIDKAFGLCCPEDIYISRPSSRPMYTPSSSGALIGFGVNNLSSNLSDYFKMDSNHNLLKAYPQYCTTNYMTSPYVGATYALSYETYIRTTYEDISDKPDLKIKGLSGMTSWLETMYNAIDDYGVNICTIGMPFHDGNTSKVPVSNYTASKYNCDPLNNDAFQYYGKYTDFILDTSAVMLGGRVPFLVLDLVNLPDYDTGNKCGQEKRSVYCAGLPFGFMYDPEEECVRQIKGANGTYYPIYTDFFKQNGLFFDTSTGGSFSLKQWAQSDFASECLGYVLPNLNNIVFFSSSYAQVFNADLLQGLYFGVYKDRCTYDLYYVNVDDKSRKRDGIDKFLRNANYCTYIGLVDVCLDLVYSLSVLPGNTYNVPANSVVYANGGIYVSTGHEFTLTDVNSAVSAGNLTEIKPNKYNFVVVTKDLENKVSEGGQASVDATLVTEVKDEYDTTVGYKDLEGNLIASVDKEDTNGEEIVLTPEYAEPIPDNSVVANEYIDPCQIESDTTTAIYKTSSKVESRDDLSSSNTTQIGIYYEGKWIYFRSEVGDIKSGVYFIDNGHVYRANANISSTAVVSSSNATLLGEFFDGVVAYYWDVSNVVKYNKNQFIIYNKSYKGITDGVVLRAKGSITLDNINNPSAYLDTSAFEVVGEGIEITIDCNKSRADFHLYYNNYPDCYTINPGQSVIQKPDTSTGETKGKVIRVVTPIQGGLSTLGQVMAAYRDMRSR